MKKLSEVRVGVIGVGGMGTGHVRRFENGSIKRGRVTAVCDIDPRKMDKFSDDYKKFTDSRELIRSGEVDAVVIATPHYFHTTIGIDAMDNGLHTLSEKPISVHKADAERLIAAHKRNPKLVFAAMFNQRTDPHYIKLRELIQSGELGEIIRVNWIITDWFRTQKYYDSGSWRATWKGEGGGVLINQCPHQLDLVQWVVGEMPVSVNGFCKYGKWHDVEVEDEVTAYFEYKNGASGVFITTTGEAPGTNRFEVSGTKGKLLCENKKLYFYQNAEDSQSFSKTSSESFAAPKCEVIEPETDGKNLQHVGILQNFSRAILGKEPLFVDGREGINGVALMNAIELSGWKDGARVSLPIDGDLYYKELMARVATSRFKAVDDNQVEGTLNFGTGFVKVKNGK